MARFAKNQEQWLIENQGIESLLIITRDFNRIFIESKRPNDIRSWYKRRGIIKTLSEIQVVDNNDKMRPPELYEKIREAFPNKSLVFITRKIIELSGMPITNCVVSRMRKSLFIRENAARAIAITLNIPLESILYCNPEETLKKYAPSYVSSRARHKKECNLEVMPETGILPLRAWPFFKP